MTPQRQQRLSFADAGGAAGLATFLTQLLRWEKASVVRLQAGTAGGGVLAVFARPARFGVLAVRTARLLEPADVDATVSAGELLEGVDDEAEALAVPAQVTGPSWAGVLPPRGGWSPAAELPTALVREAASSVIAEFRRRTEALDERERTRSAVDALAEEIWDRKLEGTALPLRAVHAAHALGFLRGPAPVTLLGSGRWLRLRTPYGSVLVREEAGPVTGLGGLSVTPLRG